MSNYKSCLKNSWLIMPACLVAAILLFSGVTGDMTAPASAADRVDIDTIPLTIMPDNAQGLNSQPVEQEDIKWQVISSGGDIGGTSTNYILSGTASQTAVGSGTSTNYGLSHGFWQESNIIADDCSPGDANDDGQVNVGDAVYLIAYIFKGGPAPQPHEICNGDANCDCQPNVGDAVYIIGYVFKGGPPPCSYGTWFDDCGPLAGK